MTRPPKTDVCATFRVPTNRGASHHLDERRELALSQTIQRDLFDEAEAKDDVLMAGQMSLHDVFLIHGSRANRSSKRRAGLTFRYMPDFALRPKHCGLSHRGCGRRLCQPAVVSGPGANRNAQNDFQVGHV